MFWNKKGKGEKAMLKAGEKVTIFVKSTDYRGMDKAFNEPISGKILKTDGEKMVLVHVKKEEIIKAGGDPEWFDGSSEWAFSSISDCFTLKSSSGETFEFGSVKESKEYKSAIDGFLKVISGAETEKMTSEKSVNKAMTRVEIVYYGRDGQVKKVVNATNAMGCAVTEDKGKSMNISSFNFGEASTSQQAGEIMALLSLIEATKEKNPMIELALMFLKEANRTEESGGTEE